MQNRNNREGLRKEEEKLGTDPLPKLILTIGAPMMISILCNALYNVVDSIFVSRIEENALTALSLAAPVQNIMSAIGSGIAVGLNAVISRAMGAKDDRKVADTARASLFLAFAAWMINVLLCVCFAKHYMAWQSGGDREIYRYGYSYLRIVMLFSLGQMGQWVFDRFLISTAKSNLFLVTLGVASVVNLILDPILIFGYFGFPEMKTAGAAIATVIGQFCGAFAGILINKRWNQTIPIVFTGRVNWARVADILKIGIPTFIMQSVVSLSGIIMNTILQAFSYTAVAVMGICVRLSTLATIPYHGINCGLIPIIAYNYGAGKRDRILESIRVVFRYDFILMGVVWVILTVFAAPILRLFDASPEMLAIGVGAVRIFAVCYYLSTVGTVYSTVFQALGKGNYSMWLTITRQVIFPVLISAFASRIGILWLVWASYVVAELFSLPLCAILMKKVKSNVLGISAGSS